MKILQQFKAWMKKNSSWDQIRLLNAKIRPFYSIAILLLSALVITQILNHYGDKEKDLKLINSIAVTKMISYRNSDSLHVAKILVFESDKVKDFTKIKSQDSVILFLQGEVQKYKSMIKKPGSSVTAISNTTDMTGTIPTTVIQANPAVPQKTNFPVYTAEKHNIWLDLDIIAKVDSIHYDLKVRNKYSVVIGYEKGLPTAMVTNYNPYTETTDMRAYSVMIPNPKRFRLGIHAGYGIVGMGFGPYIGFGINYDLINLW